MLFWKYSCPHWKGMCESIYYRSWNQVLKKMQLISLCTTCSLNVKWTVYCFNFFFFVSIGRKRDEIVLLLFFFNMICMLIGVKSPLQNRNESSTQWCLPAYDGARASVKNIKRYGRGTCVFRGKNVTDKSTVIIAQSGKEHVGGLVDSGSPWWCIKEDDLGRPHRLRGDLEMVAKLWV